MKFVAPAAAFLLLSVGCAREVPDYCQGYVEGEYVYVAAPSSGRLVSLSAAKGDRVEPGQELFVLEPEPQKFETARAAASLDQARDQLADQRKGARPHELEALSASLGQASASAEMARLEQERLEPIHDRDFVSDNDYDRARLEARGRFEAVAQARANLAEAELGAREDQIRAAQAKVRAAEAGLSRARWEMGQKTRLAPTAALVFDTFYREGEWVPAGRPVTALLPPGNVKIRFFVPQPRLPELARGREISYRFQGGGGEGRAVINYISPEVEYTPPVIFSRDNSSKLIYMVEALPVGSREGLNPGRPLEVFLSGR